MSDVNYYNELVEELMKEEKISRYKAERRIEQEHDIIFCSHDDYEMHKSSENDDYYD